LVPSADVEKVVKTAAFDKDKNRILWNSDDKAETWSLAFSTSVLVLPVPGPAMTRADSSAYSGNDIFLTNS